MSSDAIEAHEGEPIAELAGLHAMLFLGVDPGPKNMGVVLYDAVSQRVIDAAVVRIDSRTPNNRKKKTSDIVESLREKAQDPESDLGRMLGSEGLLRVCVEDQQHASRAAKNVAIQHAVAGLTPRGVSYEQVSQKSVRSRFSVRLNEGVKAGMSKARRYRLHKRNAVKYGRPFFPKEIRRTLLARKGAKLDDVCDAYWVARHAAEEHMERELGVKYD